MIYSSCIVILLLVHQYSTSAEDEMESLRKDILESIKGGEALVGVDENGRNGCDETIEGGYQNYYRRSNNITQSSQRRDLA